MTPIASWEDSVRQLVRDVVREELSTFASGGGGERNAADAYLSVAKAARVADVAPGTIRAWIRAGRLTSKRAGRVLRVGRAELERFLSGTPTGPRAVGIKQRVADHLERDHQTLRTHLR